MRNLTPIFYQTIHRVSIEFCRYTLVHDLALQLRSALEMQVGEKNTEVDIQNWMSRTALELIGQAGLGYSFDPLTEEVKDGRGPGTAATCVSMASTYIREGR